jgi:hypothetical protein
MERVLMPTQPGIVIYEESWDGFLGKQAGFLPGVTQTTYVTDARGTVWLASACPGFYQEAYTKATTGIGSKHFSTSAEITAAGYQIPD